MSEGLKIELMYLKLFEQYINNYNAACIKLILIFVSDCLIKKLYTDVCRLNIFLEHNRFKFDYLISRYIRHKKQLSSAYMCTL